MYGIHGFQIRIKDFLLTFIQVMIYISLTVLTLMKSRKKESHKHPRLFKAKCQRLNYVMRLSIEYLLRDWEVVTCYQLKKKKKVKMI